MSKKTYVDVQVVKDQEAVTMTASVNGTAINCQNFRTAQFFVETENSGGTSPTLDIKVQTYDPTQGNWFDTGITFTQITGDTTQMQNSMIVDTTNNLAYEYPLGQFIRIVYAIGGTTPTFDVTFTVVMKS